MSKDTPKKHRADTAETVTVEPEQTTAKKDAIDSAGDAGKKRTRQVLSPSKKELKAELDQLKADQIKPLMQGSDLKIVTNGLFIVIQGLTNLPFMKVEDELYDGFNEAGAACINKYFPAVAEHSPLIQLGTLSMLIVTSAMALKAEEDALRKQKTTKKVEPIEIKNVPI